jgi:hypothetical protein
MAESTQDVSAVVNEPLRVPRFQAAYQRMLPQIEKLDKNDLLIVNLDIPAVVTTVLGAISEIRKMREACAKELAGFDLTLFDEIEPMALAMGYAHSRQLAASLPQLPVQDLSDRVVEMREVLASDCAALSRRGLLDGQRLKELKGPIGYKNQGFDLLTLVAMMREAWQRIQGKTAVSSAELDQAETLADQLLTAVGEREQLPAVTAATAETRQRAYTLFLRGYDQLRRAAEYLRWHDGDADEYVPSLYNTGRRKRGSEVIAAQPQVPVAPQPPGVAKPEPAKATSNVAPGMPGSDPFTVS